MKKRFLAIAALCLSTSVLTGAAVGSSLPRLDFKIVVFQGSEGRFIMCGALNGEYTISSCEYVDTMMPVIR